MTSPYQSKQEISWKSIIRWAATTLVVAPIGIIVASNVERLAQDRKWDTLLINWWPTMLELAPLLESWWFWFTFGALLATAIWLWMDKLLKGRQLHSGSQKTPTPLPPQISISMKCSIVNLPLGGADGESLYAIYLHPKWGNELVRFGYGPNADGLHWPAGTTTGIAYKCELINNGVHSILGLTMLFRVAYRSEHRKQRSRTIEISLPLELEAGKSFFLHITDDTGWDPEVTLPAYVYGRLNSESKSTCISIKYSTTGGEPMGLAGFGPSSIITPQRHVPIIIEFNPEMERFFNQEDRPSDVSIVTERYREYCCTMFNESDATLRNVSCEVATVVPLQNRPTDRHLDPQSIHEKLCFDLPAFPTRSDFSPKAREKLWLFSRIKKALDNEPIRLVKGSKSFHDKGRQMKVSLRVTADDYAQKTFSVDVWVHEGILRMTSIRPED